MRIKTKIIILLLLFTFGSSNVFAQFLFNEIYDSADGLEFSREINMLSNGNIINVSGKKNESISNYSGKIIREIDGNGNLLWEDFIAIDTIGLFDNWQHTSVINDDTVLITLCSAANEADLPGFNNVYPYFFKYNLNSQSLLDIKFYNQFDYEATIFSTVLHNDGFIYGVGHLRLSETNLIQDILLMKLDLDGNLIWQQTFDFSQWDYAQEIESFGENLIFTGFKGNINSNVSSSIIAIIDTAGNKLSETSSVINGSNNFQQIEIINENIYYKSTTLSNFNKNIQYLSKLDASLNLIWEKFIDKTLEYEINFRDMEILNNELIIVGNILDAPQFTNNKVWSYGCSYSLNGNLKWEHIYMYDPDYTHHLDDIEVADNGDLLFMGTVFTEFGIYDYNQLMWLFRTDSEGCGIIQDTCYFTLEEYFGIDTVVSINNNYNNFQNKIEILGNPINQRLNFKIDNPTNFQKSHFEILDVNGKLIEFGKTEIMNVVNSSNWESGVYFLNVYENNVLVAREKIVKQ